MTHQKFVLRHGEIDWSTVKRTQDGNFACIDCEGSGEIHLSVPKKAQQCVSCHGTGYLVEHVLLELDFERMQVTRYTQRLNDLLEWISKNSNCKTCQGNQMKTMGGIPCEECGLEGRLPWGG